MNKNIFGYVSSTVLLMLIICCGSSLCYAGMPLGGTVSADDYKFANANVLEVSSGPIHEMPDGRVIHYRLVVILVEVNMIVYYQQVQYGDENCCLKINLTNEIFGNDLEGNFKLFSVNGIKWLAFDTVQFLGDSTRYTVKLSENGYKVEKQK